MPQLPGGLSCGPLAALLAAVLGAAALGGDPPHTDGQAPGPAWSLESLQQLALENNPTMSQAQATVGAARGLYHQYGLYPNPQVGYVQTNTYGSTPARAPGGFFSQEIVTAGKLKKTQRAQAAEVDRHAANYDAQRYRILNDVEIRYLDVLALQTSVHLAEQIVSLARSELADAEEGFRLKQVSRKELLHARMQLKTAVLHRREHEIQVDTAWDQLAAVIGCPEIVRAPVSGLLEGEVPDLDWATCWASLLEMSPLMHAARARVQVSRGDYQLERANAVPNVNFQVLADRDSIQGLSTVSALLSAPLPVFNRNQGNIRRAAHEIDEAAAEVERTKLALRDEFAEAFGRYRLAKAHVLELRDELLPLARESLDAAREDEDKNEDDPDAADERLQAERVYLDTQMSYVDAWAELRKTVVEIRGFLLTGSLNPAEIGTALQHQAGGTDLRRNVLRRASEETSKNLVPTLQLLGE